MTAQKKQPKRKLQVEGFAKYEHNAPFHTHEGYHGNVAIMGHSYRMFVSVPGKKAVFAIEIPPELMRAIDPLARPVKLGGRT